MEFQLATDYEGAKALVRIAGSDRILLMRRGAGAPMAAGLIDLPGGRNVSDESPFMTVTREVEEELGITLERGELVSSRFDMTPSGLRLWLLTFVVDEVKAGQARPVSEASEVLVESIDDYLARDDAWVGFQWLVRHEMKLKQKPYG